MSRTIHRVFLVLLLFVCNFVVCYASVEVSDILISSLNEGRQVTLLSSKERRDKYTAMMQNSNNKDEHEILLFAELSPPLLLSSRVRSPPPHPHPLYSSSLAPSDPYYAFLPRWMGSIYPVQNTTIHFNTSCFASYVVTMTHLGSHSLEMSVSISGKRSTDDDDDKDCDDLFLFGTRETFSFKRYSLEQTHIIHFYWIDSNEELDIKENGLQVFYLPDGVLGSVLDVWDTIHMFTGPKTFQDGIQFMQDHMGVIYKNRTVPNFIPDESEILDGDYIAMFGMGSSYDGFGLSSAIAWGTGGMTSHAALCLRIGGVLHVVESCGFGIIKTPYVQWMKTTSQNNTVLLSVLRLRETKLNDSQQLRQLKHLTLDRNSIGIYQFRDN
eukprot:TRINITY_DN8951_c0_g1_i5.p1 TRINITY_DN8951_c0_g1~~TRINITY_DN8951_c0_g1_i5.p1  ORF type:complete len:390 (-),score=64.55 TRINITY_DN8951_c0_g1_i5:41-1186(-)